MVTWEISSNVFSFPLQPSFWSLSLAERITSRHWLRLSLREESEKFNKDVKPQSFLTDFAFERKIFYCFSTLCVVDSTRDHRARPKVTIIEEFDWCVNFPWRQLELSLSVKCCASFSALRSGQKIEDSTSFKRYFRRREELLFESSYERWRECKMTWEVEWEYQLKKRESSAIFLQLKY